MTGAAHPLWCVPARCEAGDASPGSSRSHRSVAGRHMSAGQTVLWWRQQLPDGPLRLAFTVAVPGAGGPVALLDCDVAQALSRDVGTAAAG